MLHLQGQPLKVTVKKVCITSGISRTCGIGLVFVYCKSMKKVDLCDISFPGNLCREMVAYIANTLIFILR